MAVLLLVVTIPLACKSEGGERQGWGRRRGGEERIGGRAQEESRGGTAKGEERRGGRAHHNPCATTPLALLLVLLEGG